MQRLERIGKAAVADAFLLSVCGFAVPGARAAEVERVIILSVDGVDSDDGPSVVDVEAS